MQTFERGDVVRVPFPYTDRSTRQHRPALVVSAGEVGDATPALLWVCMITSAENRPWPDDVALGAAYANAGLPAPSVTRPAKIATIEARDAEVAGRIAPALLARVDLAIARLLGLALKV